MNKEKTLREFQTIPGIGKVCSLDLWNIGIRSIEEIKDQKSYLLYQKLNTISDVEHDICVLYTLRLAVYYVAEKTYDKEKINWWY